MTDVKIKHLNKVFSQLSQMGFTTDEIINYLNPPSVPEPSELKTESGKSKSPVKKSKSKIDIRELDEDCGC